MERDLQNLVLEYLGYQRGFFWWNPQTGVYDKRLGRYIKRNSRHYRRGAPDILGVRDGQSIGIELKWGKNGLSEYQEDFKEDFERNGGKYCVARSLKDVEDFLG